VATKSGTATPATTAVISPVATPRQAQIIEVATSVFRRYGFTRTTMADIADAVGISRPTLYTAFADKPAIFDAVIAAMVREELDRIRQGLARRRGLGPRLRYACESGVSTGYAIVAANPDARDLFDDRFAAVRAGNAAFEQLLAELLSDAVDAAPVGVTKTDLAHLISTGTQGFKHYATSTIELNRLISTLVTVILGALTATP